MKCKFTLIIVMVFILVTTLITVQAQTSQEIVREYRRIENISQNADRLINRLEQEVTKIINAGHLMPFRMQYGEQVRYYPAPSHENEFDEPWAMMFTLARAYPHVSNDLKTQIIDYIRNETELYAPWSNSALGPTGFYRQGDPAGVPEQGLPDSEYTRKGTMLYALWLYGYTTGNWNNIQSQWNNLQTIYNQIYSNYHTYELISGAIAMSRMAEQFGDEALRVQYENDAITLMNEGLDFDTYNRNAINTQTRWVDQTEWVRGTYGIAYPLFYLTPETARYISSQTTLRNSIEQYLYQEPISQLSTRQASIEPPSVLWLWPLWWMAQAPTGDYGYFGESCASGSEQRMMLFNYFAWVRNEQPQTLRYYLDVPDALVGDLYYIQNLVTTIESYGQTCWENILTGESTCETVENTFPPVRSNGQPSEELSSGTTQTIIS